MEAALRQEAGQFFSRGLRLECAGGLFLFRRELIRPGPVIVIGMRFERAIRDLNVEPLFGRLIPTTKQMPSVVHQLERITQAASDSNVNNRDRCARAAVALEDTVNEGVL